jgi:hypothetical protein
MLKKAAIGTPYAVQMIALQWLQLNRLRRPPNILQGPQMLPKLVLQLTSSSTLIFSLRSSAASRFLAAFTPIPAA